MPDKSSGEADEVDSEALADERWLVVPKIEDDGTITSSRVVREIAPSALGPLVTAVLIEVPLEGRVKVKKLDEQGDRLAAAFPQTDLVDVCRTIETDRWCWLAYARPDSVADVTARAGTVFHSFSAELTTETDGQRSALLDVAPTAEERRTANDVHVLTQLATNGDQMRAARRIDHVIGLVSADRAAEVTAPLRSAGFDVSEPFADTEGRDEGVTLDVSELAVPELGALRAARARIDNACEGTARHDGWGCPVVSAPASAEVHPETPKRRWFRR